ncbi:tail fiber domain-containing protein [Agrobacterium tumefaciens]|uniref:Tail fiber domain-containing protein n=1 Tax=Agrobacterium tumefaciens TaxID=358 RepID=A0AAJ4N5Z4_AGRTU|nr:tail fiber domain-containing protein [Agrobacterium tumefaciens]
MGSTKTTTQVQSNEPWKPIAGDVEWAFKEAVQQVKDGKPVQWQGSTIANQSGATQNALNQMEHLAGSGANSGVLQNSINTANNVMNGSGTNAQANNTLSQLMNGLNLGSNSALQGMTNQANNVANGGMPGTSTYNNLMSSTANNPALANLASTASGANIGKNPYLDQMVSNQQDQIANKLKNVTNPAISSAATQFGRQGSGAFAGQVNNANTTTANEMAKVATEAYQGQYNQDTQNMMNANNMVGSLYNAGQQNQLAAAQGADNSYTSFNNLLSNLYGQQSNAHQQGVNNQFTNANLQANVANSANSAANANAGQQLNAANSAANLYANQYLPSQMLGQVGAARDERSQDVLNAQIQQFDNQQQMPIQMLSNLIGMYNGTPYQTSTNVTQQKGNAFSSILGGLTSAVGLASKVPMLCDFRLKENIKFIKQVNGINMYKWNYIGDEVTYIGPVAQEMSITHPQFVDTTDDGYYYITLDIVREVA